MPGSDKPGSDKPGSDRPSSVGPGSDKPASGETGTKRPTTGEQTTGQQDAVTGTPAGDGGLPSAQPAAPLPPSAGNVQDMVTPGDGKDADDEITGASAGPAATGRPATSDLHRPVVLTAASSPAVEPARSGEAVPTPALCTGRVDIATSSADRAASDSHVRPGSAEFHAASSSDRGQAVAQAIAPAPHDAPPPAQSPLSHTPMPAPAPAAPASGGACPSSSSAVPGSGGAGGAHHLPWAVLTIVSGVGTTDAPGWLVLHASTQVISRADVPGSSPG